tara:strand:+ start:520 stop:924 length:405 start_codon:yes stop_codon:yes gene_type:complete
MSECQIISFFNINNENHDLNEESVMEYIEIVVNFLDDVYETLEQNDISEYEPVMDKIKVIRNARDVSTKLGKYKQIKKDDCLLNDCECSICCGEYKCGEYKRELPCSHVFHKKCIDKWLCSHDHCPMCRETIIK